MRKVLFGLCLATALGAAPAPVASRAREIENVAAFARLYGVVRYFYPSDAAASLDWNAFAVHGVTKVRTASDAQALQAALNALVTPLGPGLEIGARLSEKPEAPAGSDLVAWRYLGAGFSTGGPYRAQRTRRAATATIDGFVNVMQTMPALTLRGKTIRLSGRVRATASDSSGSGALWLRVDRPSGAMGFFDNMGDRPIRDPEWREYTIEGTVADDATAIAFGAMASGAVTADFDAIQLSWRDATGAWTAIVLADSGFEAAAGDTGSGWVRAGTSRSALVSRPGEAAPEGHQFLRFAAPSAGDSRDLFSSSFSAPHADVDLGSGLWARVPLALTDAGARTDETHKARLDLLKASLRDVAPPGETLGLDVRLADVIVTWNVFRHFYPYWSESAVDWDLYLRPRLEAEQVEASRAQHQDDLRLLVADARDGHGYVADTLSRTQRGSAPILFAVVEGRLVISASESAEAPVGAEVTAIDGVPVSERLAREMRLLSGTMQWRESRATRELASCRKDSTLRLHFETDGKPREVSLQCSATRPPQETRPAAVSELQPGLWYVDLTRATKAEVVSKVAQLADAHGVVFDVRGYPTDAGVAILPHLVATAEFSRWMHVAKLVGPFGKSEGWESFGWNLRPATPRLRGRIAFLTDGRAISYAESVMGYVRDLQLARVVGGVTAGTNGNVATFRLPGGFTIGFTGMRVTGRDGKTPFHLIGVRPDVAVAPTLAGLRTGRDEVLERGLELVREPR